MSRARRCGSSGAWNSVFEGKAGWGPFLCAFGRRGAGRPGLLEGESGGMPVPGLPARWIRGGDRGFQRLFRAFERRGRSPGVSPRGVHARLECPCSLQIPDSLCFPLFSRARVESNREGVFSAPAPSLPWRPGRGGIEGRRSGPRRRGSGRGGIEGRCSGPRRRGSGRIMGAGGAPVRGFGWCLG